MGSKNLKQLQDNLGAVGWSMEEQDYTQLSSRGSEYAEVFDYDYSMFGMKYDEIKIDKMIDDTI